MLKELISAVAKVAEDVVNNPTALAAGISAGKSTEKAAKKIGLLKERKYGGLMLKVPFFKTVDDKIEKVFAENPDRNKFCFHFTFITDGIDFYDPDGNIIYKIPGSQRNLKHLLLYQGNQVIGKTDRKTTFNLNPFASSQKYEIYVSGTTGMMYVSNMSVNISFEAWTLKHVIHKGYIVENSYGKELGKIHVLGTSNYVADYTDSVNPVALILAFMAIMTNREYNREHARHYH